MMKPSHTHQDVIDEFKVVMFPEVVPARERLRNYPIEKKHWNDRDAALLVEYAGLDWGKKQNSPPVDCVPLPMAPCENSSPLIPMQLMHNILNSYRRHWI
jgi:hypothetical protein